MGARPAIYSVNRKTNCSIINFLSSVHYCIKEPQNYVASLQMKQVKNEKDNYVEIHGFIVSLQNAQEVQKCAT